MEEQKKYTIEINEAGIDVILNAIAALPYKNVHSLIGSLLTQVRAQNVAPTAGNTKIKEGE